MTQAHNGKVLFSFSEDEKLVERVSKFPCLFDLANSLHKNQRVKDKAWRDVAEYLQRSVEDCKKRWRNIKDTYIKRRKKGKGSRKLWSLYNKLSFLGEVEYIRKRISNTVAQESEEEIIENIEMHQDTSNSSEILFDNVQSTSKTSVTSPKKRTSQSYTQQKFDEKLAPMMEDKLSKRAKRIQALGRDPDDDEIDLFFKSIAMSVKKLKPELQSEAKLQTLKIIIHLESRNDISAVDTSQMSP